MQEIEAARRAAEKTLGIAIPDEISEEVLEYAKRKCELNHKPESYLPILFENELVDYFTRLVINLKGAENYVRYLLAYTM